MGKWKGIVLNIFKGNRKIQLYDLDSDPREQTDVARYHPENREKNGGYYEAGTYRTGTSFIQNASLEP